MFVCMRSPFQAPPAPESLIKGLNPEQRRAVEHTGSPLLIVAGAGSGKTAVLTRRIAYLMGVRGTHPGQILAITFTNKAANEMKERVGALIGPVAQRMWVATFHSTCVRILREQAHLVPGINTNFTVYDSDDSKRLLGMIAKDMHLDVKKFTPRVLATTISNWKNELITPATAGEEAHATKNPFTQVVAEVFEQYQRRLRGANAVDFDDLIGETVTVALAPVPSESAPSSRQARWSPAGSIGASRSAVPSTASPEALGSAVLAVTGAERR